MAKATKKPLSFTTTLRNPSRIAAFLKCLKPYAGQILTNDVIMNICVEVIRQKLYKPNSIGKCSKWQEIYKDEDKIFSIEDAKNIIKKSPQNHKEAGFDKGWASRFDTWYKLAMEFGFIYYCMGELLIVSQTGYMLIDALNNGDSATIQKIFLNAMMKYQANNPFRKTLNDNAPLPLLLQIIKKLKDEKDGNDKGIFRKEIALLLCMSDNNVEQLYKDIKAIRKQYGFSYSDDIIYKKCLKMLGVTGTKAKKRFKKSQIMGEAVDEYIRKMRITGVISLRGEGRFLDFNSQEQKSINYVLKKYVNYQKYSKKYDYFKYMGTIDNSLFALRDNNKTKNLEKIKMSTLEKWARDNSFEFLSKALKACYNNKTLKVSKNEIYHNVLTVLDEPVKLEFLTSIILKKKFPKMIVKPNYSVDDEGLPKFTAAGGMADIECFDRNNNPLVEVTLMRNRKQSTNEIPAITRHLQEAVKKYHKKLVFTLFIAPIIHEDTKYMVEFSFVRHHVDIVPLTIEEFIIKIDEIKKMKEFIKCNSAMVDNIQNCCKNIEEKIEEYNSNI